MSNAKYPYEGCPIYIKPGVTLEECQNAITVPEALNYMLQYIKDNATQGHGSQVFFTGAVFPASGQISIVRNDLFPTNITPLKGDLVVSMPTDHYSYGVGTVVQPSPYGSVVEVFFSSAKVTPKFKLVTSSTTLAYIAPNIPNALIEIYPTARQGITFSPMGASSITCDYARFQILQGSPSRYWAFSPTQQNQQYTFGTMSPTDSITTSSAYTYITLL